MTLSFFSCSRSALLYSIIIIGAFFIFGQIGVTHAATPVPPNPTYPANTWTSTIPSGSITFQWSYTGDTTNIWFYFFMYKWDFQQSKWVVVTSEYAKTDTYDTQFLADGYYAWRVAAVDILQQDPTNWYKWNTDWVKLQLYTTSIPTPGPTSTYTATPTPAPTPTPVPTTYTCTLNSTTYNNMITWGDITASECYPSGINYICTFSKTDYDSFIAWGRFLPSACVANGSTPTPTPTPTPAPTPTPTSGGSPTPTPTPCPTCPTYYISPNGLVVSQPKFDGI